MTKYQIKIIGFINIEKNVTKDMVFQCPYCSRRFENVETFRFQKYTHEKMEELNLLIPDKMRSRKIRISTIQKCKSCGAEFYDQDELFRFHEDLHQTEAEPSTEDIFYSFRKVNQRTYKTNKAIDRHCVVKLNSNLVQEERRVVDLHYNLAQMFGATLRDATISLRYESDFIRVIIHSDTLITPIIIPLRKIEKMTPQLILHHINHVL